MILTGKLLAVALGVSLTPCGDVDLDGVEPSVANAADVGIAAYRDQAPSGPAAGKLGMLFHANGLLDAAAACYRSAGLREPGQVRWAYLAGVVAEESGRLDDAVANYWSALRAEPEYLPALVRLAAALRLQGDLDGAGDLLLRVDRSDAPPALRAALGEQALAAGRYDEAVRQLEAAAAAEPSADRLNYLLAQALRELGRDEEARDRLAGSGTVGLVPNDPLLNEVRGMAAGEVVPLLDGRRAYQAGDFEGARAAFGEAVARNPENVEARINLAATLEALGERQAARDLLVEVLDDVPDNRTARYNLAAIYEYLDPVAAIAEYRTLLASTPDDTEARYRLGLLLAAAGQFDEARTQLEPGLSDLRLFLPAARALAEVLVQSGDDVAARELLERARAVAPTDEALAESLVILLTTARDLPVRDGAAALELAEEMHQALGTEKSARLVAMAHAELEQCGAAREWLAIAADLATDPEQAAQLAAFAESLSEPCRPQ